MTLPKIAFKVTFQAKLHQDFVNLIYSELFECRSEYLHINLKIKHIYSTGKT